MNRNKKVISVSIITALLILETFNLSFAETKSDVKLKNISLSQNINKQNVIKKAKMWGLTESEYKKYLREMKDTPSEKWWKNLDPPQVLGQNANTQKERMKYAYIDVKLDQERATREIAFQHAYEKAFKNLYPRAKLIDIDTSKSNSSNAVKSGDQLFLFTSIHDPEGSLIAEKLITLMKHTYNSSLNIFFVGKATFGQIESWGRNNNIPNRMQNSNEVSLNHNIYHGVNKLKSIVGDKNASIPLLIRVREGNSKIISLLSI